MTRLTLYDYWRSTASYRVRIALGLKGQAFETVPVNIAPGVEEHRGEPYRALNPQMRVPALETGTGLLTQSLAIIEWLEETRPEPPLLPRDPWERAEVRAFALTIACDIHPLNNSGPLKQLRERFGANEAATGEWIRHWITGGFDALEARLGSRAAPGPWCFGAGPGLAEVCLVPQAYSARRFGVDISAWPRLARASEVAEAIPAFLAALPDRQKDAPAP